MIFIHRRNLSTLRLLPAAAERLFVEVYNMTPDAVTDMIDNTGMKNASAFLRQQGYTYDESGRQWLVMVQLGDVFAERNSNG